MLLGVLFLCSGIALANLSTAPLSVALESAGIRGVLPAGWSLDPEVNSRKEIRATGPQGESLSVTTSPYLVPITEETVRGAGRTALHRLYRLRATQVQLVSAQVVQVGGAPVGEVVGSGVLPDGKTVTVVQRTFPSGEAMASVSVRAGSEEAARAVMDAWTAEQVVSGKPVASDAFTRTVSRADGTSITLPPGWRAPLPSEREAINIELRLEDDGGCWVGIRPDLAGVDMLRGCPLALHPGVVNERSLAKVDAQIRERVPALSESAPAVLSWSGSRPSLSYAPANPGPEARRTVLTPSSTGLELIMASSPERDMAALDADLAVLLGSDNYPEDAYTVTVTDQILYLTTHRLDLLGALCLPFLLGGAIWWRRSQGPGWEALSEEAS